MSAATAGAPDLTSFQKWYAGSRPKTWPAGIVPVLVGSGAAAYGNEFVWWRALLALVVGLAMQIGVNYANDYSDGIRGTDEQRVGPLRLTATGLAKPQHVKLAAFLSFAIGAVAGLVLALVTQPWLIAVGVACILAGWFYTGGKRPYGYAGLGEVMVFIFFGLVATIGTAWVQTEDFTLVSVFCAVAVGSLAVALLVVNNLRDIPTDAATGKRTLAVMLGDGGTRWLYISCIIVPFVMVLVLALYTQWTLLALVAVLAAVGPVRLVSNGTSGRNLVPVLQKTGRLQLVFGVLLTVGLSL